jgi:hypothetical protein
MATSTTAHTKMEARAARGYAAALKEAGVNKDDLQLLRELADLNASELSPPSDHVPPSRLLVKAGRPSSAR